jgi:hypothetical protein
MSTSTPSLADRVAALEAEVAALPAAQDTLTPNLLLYNPATKTWSPPAWLAQLASLNPTDLQTAKNLLGVGGAALLTGVPTNGFGFPTPWGNPSYPSSQFSGSIVGGNPFGHGEGAQVQQSGGYLITYSQLIGNSTGSTVNFQELIGVLFGNAIDTFQFGGGSISLPPGDTAVLSYAAMRFLNAGTWVEPAIFQHINAILAYGVGLFTIARVA